MALRRIVPSALRASGSVGVLGAAEARAAGGAGARACVGAVAALRVPGSASCSCSYSTAGGEDATEAERTKLVNKLSYRAKQRGFLELDLLVGLWAESALPRMSAAELRDFAAVLDEENPDLFKWLTGQLPSPEHLAHNTQYMALKTHVAQQLSDNLHHAAAAASGAAWVRGWDDGSRAAGGGAGGEAHTAGVDK